MAKKKVPTVTNYGDVAVAIARDLFTNGDNKRATRLVLEMPNGSDGGGWCESAVVGQIIKTIRKELGVN